MYGNDFVPPEAGSAAPPAPAAELRDQEPGLEDFWRIVGEDAGRVRVADHQLSS